MKSLFSLLITLSLITISISSCNRNSSSNNSNSSKVAGIRFETASYKQVLDKAKKTNKPVFIDIYATWCGPCKMMERTVFSDKKVGDFHNANFINYRIDGEKGEGRDLVKQFRVAGYPTLLYVDGNGKVLRSEIGALEKQDLLQVSKAVLQNKP